MQRSMMMRARQQQNVAKMLFGMPKFNFHSSQALNAKVKIFSLHSHKLDKNLLICFICYNR